MAQPDRPREADRSDGIPPPGRRPYRKPELIEYGSVAKLTQSGSITGGDSMGMTMACL
ncbi:MAG: lasso RiPP family leader peptide-containing protein [Vicinamibacterales bacterium]